MEQLFIVEEKGIPESYWFCARSVVDEYIDSKPCKDGSRNSIEVSGDWKAKRVSVYTTLSEKAEGDHMAAVKSAMDKLTEEELSALRIAIGTALMKV